MSYSKVFSGDLPELTYEIIKYFQNDISTLHSCILVNRLWCRLAIPLLWENPFSFRTGNYNFIEIYLHNLNNDLKSRLNEYKINDNSLPLNTLFNYPRLLKYLNTFNIDSCVEIWFEVAVRTSKPGNRYFLKDLSSYSVSDFKRLINISLFKIFIENEVNLRTLEIEIPNIYSSKYLNYILEIILQNTNFIHNIRNLNLYIIKSSNVSDDNINNEYELIENRVSQIINLHKNTKKILLSNDNIPLFQSLLLSKHSNCSNTLNTIIFYYANLNVYEDPNGNGERSSTLLQNLGQTLPSKLEYLSLTLRIKENDFRVFLENSQNIFINKLKIMQDDSYSNILHCIKEYIMKEKRVNYLAISNHRGDDLYFFKDEVKEFNLYNIKVLNFYDLALAYNAYNLVRKID
ncbi:unnamed protein product [Rhizophagus irregularis]|nr:unnamed protein product [Rhizophagus irregularis]